MEAKDVGLVLKVSSQSMRQMYTVLRNYGPDHLVLWGKVLPPAELMPHAQKVRPAP